MEVIFCYNQSDARAINKTLSYGAPFEGIPVNEVSSMNPIIRFESEDVMFYNYAYIPELLRYFSVKDRTCYREGIWDITFEIDVLMSFRNDIMALTAVVDKQSNPEIGDEYIDDGSLVADNVCFTTVYEFSNGFNSTGEYILITAG